MPTGGIVTDRADDPIASWRRILVSAFSDDVRWPRSVRVRSFAFSLALRRALRVGTVAHIPGVAVMTLTPPRRFGPWPTLPLCVFGLAARHSRGAFFAAIGLALPLTYPTRLTYEGRTRWVLSNVAAEPRRSGWGSALLAGVCTTADARGFGLALRTSSSEAVQLYARHGFRIIEQATRTRATVMIREPTPDGSAAPPIAVDYAGRWSGAWSGR